MRPCPAAPGEMRQSLRDLGPEADETATVDAETLEGSLAELQRLSEAHPDSHLRAVHAGWLGAARAALAGRIDAQQLHAATVWVQSEWVAHFAEQYLRDYRQVASPFFNCAAPHFRTL